MSSTATVTMLGEPSYSDITGWRQSVKVSCPECTYVAFTGGHLSRDWSRILDPHMRQHLPGNALDIEVEYVLSASCSVCEGGGDVRHEEEQLKCHDCGTTWSEDGTGGETAEREE